MTDAEGQRWRDLAEKQQLAFEALMGNDGSRYLERLLHAGGLLEKAAAAMDRVPNCPECGAVLQYASHNPHCEWGEVHAQLRGLK